MCTLARAPAEPRSPFASPFPKSFVRPCQSVLHARPLTRSSPLEPFCRGMAGSTPSPFAQGLSSIVKLDMFAKLSTEEIVQVAPRLVLATRQQPMHLPKRCCRSVCNCACNARAGMVVVPRGQGGLRRHHCCPPRLAGGFAANVLLLHCAAVTLHRSSSSVRQSAQQHHAPNRSRHVASCCAGAHSSRCLCSRTKDMSPCCVSLRVQH
jgi:hypothetical protein